MSDQPFSVTLELKQGYTFEVDFDQAGLPPLVMDEPPPLGEGRGPNASRVLAAAVGNCLSASALYCLRRARIEVQGLRTVVTGRLARNERGRLRIGGLSVTLHLDLKPEDRSRIGRCLELFEDFCVVTESVRRGVDVAVRVEGVEIALGGPSGA
jgi:organic hydroperoxide reductase OsmC/OhrA